MNAQGLANISWISLPQDPTLINLPCEYPYRYLVQEKDNSTSCTFAQLKQQVSKAGVAILCKARNLDLPIQEDLLTKTWSHSCFLKKEGEGCACSAQEIMQVVAQYEGRFDSPLSLNVTSSLEGCFFNHNPLPKLKRALNHPQTLFTLGFSQNVSRCVPQDLLSQDSFLPVFNLGRVQNSLPGCFQITLKNTTLLQDKAADIQTLFQVFCKNASDQAVVLNNLNRLNDYIVCGKKQNPQGDTKISINFWQKKEMNASLQNAFAAFSKKAVACPTPQGLHKPVSKQQTRIYAGIGIVAFTIMALALYFACRACSGPNDQPN